MATYKSFTELPIWQKAHQIALKTYEISNESKLSKDFALKDQMRRCAISISSNIAEGHDRGSKKQNCYFLYVAKASSAELRSQLFLAKDLNYIEIEKFSELEKSVCEINNMLGGFIKYLNSINS